MILSSHLLTIWFQIMLPIFDLFWRSEELCHPNNLIKCLITSMDNNNKTMIDTPVSLSICSDSWHSNSISKLHSNPECKLQSSLVSATNYCNFPIWVFVALAAKHHIPSSKRDLSSPLNTHVLQSRKGCRVI